MNILDKIIDHKRREVVEHKKQVSTKQLEQAEQFDLPRKRFADELKRSDKIGIIAEYKRRSPSKGVINNLISPVDAARGYEAAGASALSILTDADFFSGSNLHLLAAAEAVQIPILRKDFVIDEFQIVEARAFGASAILLIAAVLNAGNIRELAAFAHSLDLDVLLEVHEESEIPEDLTDIAAVGVNNRDLRDFSVSVERSFQIAEKLPAETIKVSESGLADARTILKLKQAGFSGFLIGETFMKTSDPAAACARLIEEVRVLSKEVIKT